MISESDRKGFVLEVEDKSLFVLNLESVCRASQSCGNSDTTFTPQHSDPFLVSIWGLESVARIFLEIPRFAILYNLIICNDSVFKKKRPNACTNPPECSLFYSMFTKQNIQNTVIGL